MLIHYSANLNYRFDQLLGSQNVAQAQRRVEYLAHRSRVDNTTGVIKPLQTREWGTGITKFGIMIVLENVSVAGARKIDQSRSSRETHRHTQRELMGRCDVNYFGRVLFRQPRNRDSLAVNRSGNDGRTGEPKGPASLVKAGIFNPRDLTPIYERHRADHHCLLRPSGDDNLVRVTTRASVIAQIGC